MYAWIHSEIHLSSSALYLAPRKRVGNRTRDNDSKVINLSYDAISDIAALSRE
jgi:hypothetical protein